jgi:hypothetical protein
MWATNTFKNDLLLIQSVYAMLKEAAPRLSSNPGLSLFLTIQPIPRAITAKSGPRGGNSLGLDPASDGAMVLCLISSTWDTEADDAEIDSVIMTLKAQIDDTVKAHGLFHDWIYLNYAGDFQDPLGSYGAANAERLRAVSRKYDPNQVFQKMVPGGFKLFRETRHDSY